MNLRKKVPAQRKRNMSSGDRRRVLRFQKYHHTNLAGENVKVTDYTKTPTSTEQGMILGSQTPHFSLQNDSDLE